MVRLRSAVVFLSLSLLLPTFGSASELRGVTAPPEVGPTGLDLVWNLASDVWASIAGLFDKEGSSIDPFGKPSPPPSGTSTTGTGGSEAQGIPTFPE